MKKLSFLKNSFIRLIGLFFILFFISCENSSDDVSTNFQIKNLTIENYPKVDGSTSTEPLQVLIACKLFDLDYSWVYTSFWYKYNYRIMPSVESKPDAARLITEQIYHHGTHSSFVRLINKNADLILTARTTSDDEQDLADSLGIELIETPIALDAFVFLNNIHNPVNSLTTKEIKEIYTGNIKYWSEVGGTNTQISPYQRNSNSGSQELMKSLIMKDIQMPDYPDMIIYGMMGLINQIEYDKKGLGYSVNYYTQYMARSDSIKTISVDGVKPDYNSIKNQKYGYTTTVYAIIRQDLGKKSEAYKLYELLSKASGQKVVQESGYVPYY
jgi:phosphate transport system substrate-binding protein